MDDDSPAVRYAAARTRAAAARTEAARFAAGLGFILDDFQVPGCAAVEEGRSVLVAAPTGAGKTVVGEFACHLALAQGRKAFYTTPIKALSNQKYQDLAATYGADRVGLLTGDQSINPAAPLVVMTTEVLRNMLYANSPALDGLGYAVMDEVHYLADRFRGGVWEEVIVHLAPDVQVVSLSATVSNAEEFGAWLEVVRGDTAVVVSEHRPVPLDQHIAVATGASARLLDLYAEQVEQVDPGPNPPVNPEIHLALRSAPLGSGDRGFRGRGRRVPTTAPRRPPSRQQVVAALERAGMLPAIYFIFSRAGCEAGVRSLVTSGVRLTTPRDVEAIRDVVAARTAHVNAADLDAVGFWAFANALERGIAAHHAGMLPAFKETVEDLFARGLVKIVFATETLALGINMPARTVVLEKLIKWDGVAHEPITPGQYTQLTGRAGRRGIDTLGHAVVVDHPGMDPAQVAGLASKRTYPLRSSFTPTPNMAVNLVDQLGSARAREVLEMSFAQFQADRAVVGLARQAQAQSEALEGYAAAQRCERGDWAEYLDIRRRLTAAEDASRSARRAEHALRIRTGFARLTPGDVIARLGRYVVVLGGAMPTVLTTSGKIKTLAATDITDPQPAAHIRIPKTFTPRAPSARRDLAARLRAATDHRPAPRHTHTDADDAAASALRAALSAHPCHACPDRAYHARWAARYQGLSREHATLMRRITGRTGSIARDFDKITGVLVELGYMERDGGLTVTGDGRWLGRLYAENDLLIAESLRLRVWDGLDPAGLAGVVAGACYSGRGDGAGASVPGPVRAAIDDTVRAWSRLDDLRIAHGLTAAAPMDLTLVTPMWRWARGAHLADVLAEADLAAGDFVRWCKQVVDVLDQVASVAPHAPTREAARAAIASVRRGVVALGTA